MLYRIHLAWVGFELTALVVIGNDCIGSCKSNYHTITTTMAPVRLWSNKTLTTKCACYFLMRWQWRQFCQHAELDFYCARSLKQLSKARHVAQLWYIIVTPSQPVFVLTHCYVLSWEATNTSFIFYGLTWSEWNPWTIPLTLTC